MSDILIHRKPRLHSRNASTSVSPEDSPGRSTAQTIKTLAYEALPAWCQDNPSIRAGYRPISNSYRLCAKSLIGLHNETLNILTHMVPAVVLAVAQFFIQMAISRYFPEATVADRVVIGSNVLAAVITFTLSTLYHTLMNHSEAVSHFYLKLDFTGILTLILGSFISAIYVGFYCDPVPRTVYWTMITLLSVLTATLVLHPKFQGPRYRPLRTYAFVATALTGVAPVSHGLYKYGWNEMWIRSGMPYWFAEGLFYLGGVFFFLTGFPESVWPGRFDLFSSHAIFHVLVVVASLVHMYGVWSAFGWHYENARMCNI